MSACGEKSNKISKQDLGPSSQKLFTVIEKKLELDFNKKEVLEIIAKNPQYTKLLSEYDVLDEEYSRISKIVNDLRNEIRTIEARIGVTQQLCYDGKEKGKRVFSAHWNREIVPQSVMKKLAKIDNLRLLGSPSAANKLKLELIEEFKLTESAS